MGPARDRLHRPCLPDPESASSYGRHLLNGTHLFRDWVQTRGPELRRRQCRGLRGGFGSHRYGGFLPAPGASMFDLRRSIGRPRHRKTRPRESWSHPYRHRSHSGHSLRRPGRRSLRWSGNRPRHTPSRCHHRLSSKCLRRRPQSKTSSDRLDLQPRRLPVPHEAVLCTATSVCWLRNRSLLHSDCSSHASLAGNFRKYGLNLYRKNYSTLYLSQFTVSGPDVSGHRPVEIDQCSTRTSNGSGGQKDG